MKFRLPQKLTYWQNTGPNGYGGIGFGGPQTMDTRWQATNEMFLDSEGKQQVSRGVAYLEESIEEGGYMVLGEHADAGPIEDAQIVRNVQASPSIDGSQTLYKAML